MTCSFSKVRKKGPGESARAFMPAILDFHADRAGKSF
jgi:hypothetical protein